MLTGWSQNRFVYTIL